MTAERTSQGDPRRSMELLWGRRPAPTRGPKQGLSVARIVARATEIADAEGLAALSMRRVAEGLGVGTMSLYTYVPSKAELLDVMLDTAYGELVGVFDEATGWREGLEARARASWDLYARHPWILQVAGARVLLGPNELQLFEDILGTVAGTGLRGREMVAVTSLVGRYVQGAAQAYAEARGAHLRTGVSDDEWWVARSAILDEVWDPERWPLITAVQDAGAFEDLVVTEEEPYLVAEARADFEFGLARVLDGIGAFIAARAGGDPA